MLIKKEPFSNIFSLLLFKETIKVFFSFCRRNTVSRRVENWVSEVIFLLFIISFDETFTNVSFIHFCSLRIFDAWEFDRKSDFLNYSLIKCLLTFQFFRRLLQGLWTRRLDYGIFFTFLNFYFNETLT
jgi:hypothetical protein